VSIDVFVILNTLKVFYTISISIFCSVSKQNFTCTNGSLVITIKLKEKYKCHVAVVLLFCLPLKYDPNKSWSFFGALLPHQILGPCIKMCYCCSHLSSSHSHYVDVIDSGTLECTKVGWPLMALCLFQVS
jgi:hypothetical protein